MDAEDDDLVALRTAALASLSAKPPGSAVSLKEQEDEEDLESLRLAALMTRKQNQKIQVIYQHPSVLQQVSPHINFWKSNPRVHTNLISLTPDPLADPIPKKQTVTPMQKSGSAAKPSTADSKVSNKFSRYNSDSSSDEDEEHTVKKPCPDDGDAADSDAESVTSDRSFSSASEIYQDEPEQPVSNDDSGVEDEEETTAKPELVVEENAGSPSSVVKEKEEESKDKEMEADEEDNISISGGDNEEDDILAAIDDFLEDKPEKLKTKSAPKKPDKSDKTATSKKDSIMVSGEVKQSASKDNISKQHRKNQSESSKEKSNTNNVGKLQHRKREDNTRSRVKKKAAASNALESRHENGRSRSTRRKATSGPSAIVKGHRDVPPAELPSPPRKRRDSDLDSVGTSDLSFLSSDGESEKTTHRKTTKERVEASSSRNGRSQQSYVANEDKVKTAPKDGTEASSLSRHNDSRSLNRTTTKDRSKSRSNSRSGSQNHSGSERVSKENRRSSDKTFQSKKTDVRQDAASKDLRKKLEVKGLKRKQPRRDSVDAEHKRSSPQTQRKGSRSLLEKSSSFSEVKESTQTMRRSGIINLKKKKTLVLTKSSNDRKSKSKELSTNSSVLPDLQEARRIIITRPNDFANSKSLHTQSKRRNTDKHSKSAPVADAQKPKASRKHGARSPDEEPVRRKQRSVLPPKTSDNKKRLLIKELVAAEPARECEQTSRRTRSSDGRKSREGSEDETDVEEEETDVKEEEVFAVSHSSLPEYDEILGNVDVSDGEYDAESRSSYGKEEHRSHDHERAKKAYKQDRRRFVPKSSPERSYPEATEEKNLTTAPGKLSVHQRLGLPSKHGNLASTVKEKAGDPSRSGSKRRKESSARSGRTEQRITVETREQREEYRRMNQNNVAKTKKSCERSWSDVDSDMGEKNKRSNKEKEKVVHRQKRKIEISGKNSSSLITHKKKDEVEASENKASLVKNRLGLASEEPALQRRRIVQSSVWVPEADNVLEEARRKKRKREGKASSSLMKDKASVSGKDDELEARIRRIKEQNGLIMKRQKEIAREKEKFGF